MTNQEIFDTIVAHMREQKYSCMDDSYCRYYDPETERKCAVGCLIPIEMYVAQMDEDMTGNGTGVRANNLVLDTLESIGVDLELSLNLLADMQRIHDSLYDLEWGKYQEQQCLDVAEKHNLVYTPA